MIKAMLAAQKCSSFQRSIARLGAFRHHQGGVSAIEFALFAPLLVTGLLALADVGIAAHQRMSIEHALRAGAQRAMAEATEASISSIIKATAEEDFSISGTTSGDGKPPLTVAVERRCVCGDDGNFEPVCPSVCATTARTPKVFMLLTASSTYSGMILGKLVLTPQITVQVR